MYSKSLWITGDIKKWQVNQASGLWHCWSWWGLSWALPGLFTVYGLVGHGNRGRVRRSPSSQGHCRPNWQLHRRNQAVNKSLKHNPIWEPRRGNGYRPGDMWKQLNKVKPTDYFKMVSIRGSCADNTHVIEKSKLHTHFPRADKPIYFQKNMTDSKAILICLVQFCPAGLICQHWSHG